MTYNYRLSRPQTSNLTARYCELTCCVVESELVSIHPPLDNTQQYKIWHVQTLSRFHSGNRSEALLCYTEHSDQILIPHTHQVLMWPRLHG